MRRTILAAACLLPLPLAATACKQLTSGAREDFAARCVTLPLFPQMEGWQSELVIEAARESLARSRRAKAAA